VTVIISARDCMGMAVAAIAAMSWSSLVNSFRMDVSSLPGRLSDADRRKILAWVWVRGDRSKLFGDVLSLKAWPQTAVLEKASCQIRKWKEFDPTPRNNCALTRAPDVSAMLGISGLPDRQYADTTVSSACAPREMRLKRTGAPT